MSGKDGLDQTLVQIEQRLQEESSVPAADPNGLTFLRATGQRPARPVSTRPTDGKRTLSLVECLRLAFEGNNEIKQTRQQIQAVGGTRLIANSRFLPTMEIVNQYEHVRDFESMDTQQDSLSLGALLTQRLFEYGKDNPIDVSLRRDQRQALFAHENQVAWVFSQVRRAFYFIQLKDRQIATRRQLLEQFQSQYQKKQQRMDAGNLSVKIEVLTAKLNVLNEQTRINALERQRFNRKMELLRLIGLPIGADAVEFKAQEDTFGLAGFDMERMVGLALAQSSDVALAEALAAEQSRVLDQLRWEYLPDLRAIIGYQDRNGLAGVNLTNQDDIWGVDAFGQPKVYGSKDQPEGLGLFGDDLSASGPDAGWVTGLQLRFPLANGRSREGRRLEGRALLAQLKAALDDRKDQIELVVRQSYKFLTEQQFQVQLAQENVAIEKERFSIQEQLRDVGRINDDALETFRERFFSAQDSLFSQQEGLIDRQEGLRAAVRYFGDQEK